MGQCISPSHPRHPNSDPESLRNLEMQKVNAYLYCEGKKRSIHMFTDKWQGIEIYTKEGKIIEAEWSAQKGWGHAYVCYGKNSRRVREG